MVFERSVNENSEIVSHPQKNRSPLTIILLLLSLILLSLTIIFAVLYVRKSSNDDNSEKICMTPYCIHAANYLLESIDETVDPCEDFYNFACGNWIRKAKIPDDSGVQNIFNFIGNQLTSNIIDVLSIPSENETAETNSTKNARILFNSCMNETQIEMDNIDPILFIIKTEFGGWPILEGPFWNNSNFNLTQILLKLRKYEDGFIYSVNTATNEQNSSIYDIELGQGTLGLDNREYYDNHTEITTAYRQFMIDLASIFTNDTATIQNDVYDMFILEQQISEIYWNDEEQRLRENETIRTTISELKTHLNTDFDFTVYLRQIYSFGEVNLFETDLVTVSEVEYLKNVSQLLSTKTPRIIQNYLVWRFMMNRALVMPQRVRQTREKFDRVFKGINSEPGRSTMCANFVNDNMGFAVSRLYLKYYFDESARNQSYEIIANVRSSFMEMLKSASWMDQTSKDKAVDKAQDIFENIGYPDYVVNSDSTKLDQIYQNYYFDPLSFFGNVIHLQAAKSQSDLKKLHTSVDHRAWGDLAPTVVNAFYEPSTNSISFPAGILQTPYFNKDAPKYLNYGGIGMVIGHEITHGFDDTGRQYDKYGNLVSWWSNSTIQEFNNRKQCIIDQYNNYTVKQINEHLNGIQTQGENIADNGGIKSSFRAYQQWSTQNPNVDLLLPGMIKYNQEQLFFIGYAHGWCAKMTNAYALSRVLNDVHSIPQFRVLGPLSNFDQFDKTFQCKPGQGTSRVNKCSVW